MDIASGSGVRIFGGSRIAFWQEIAYDDMGNVKTGTLMDFFLPTAWEVPNYETDFTVTPSPHHPIGASIWVIPRHPW